MNGIRHPLRSLFPALSCAFLLLLAGCEADPNGLSPGEEGYKTSSSPLSYTGFGSAGAHAAAPMGETSVSASEVGREAADASFDEEVFEEDDPCYTWLNGSDAERASISDREALECERAYLMQLAFIQRTQDPAGSTPLPTQIQHGEPTPFSGGGGNVDHGEPTPFDGPGTQPAP